jgi:hypothetical protein
MEARFGADLSGVRIHADTAARASAAAVGARAYTSGYHVVIGPGAAGKHILAHELAHVIQQREGPVSGSDAGSGLIVSDLSDRFERAAEAAAGHAVRGTLTGSPLVPAGRASTLGPDIDALQGGQPLRGGPANGAAAAPLPIQRLTVNNTDVDIASLSTRQAEEYSTYLRTGQTTGRRDVGFGPGDETKLAEALSIKGRIDALDRQIAGSTAKIRVRNRLVAPARREDTKPGETSITIWTWPHLAAGWKKRGPLKLWSGQQAEKQAKRSGGFMMGQTPHGFLGTARVIAVYGSEDVNERDPGYHKDFVKWLEEPIEDQDLANAGISPDRRSEFVDGVPRQRSWLLGDPDGGAYAEDKLEQLRKDWETSQKADKSGPSRALKSKRPEPPTGEPVDLIGYHDANFHSIWDLASQQVVVDAVRSFTPIASYGIPGHGAPEKTIQFQTEIPAIQNEAGLQKREIYRLVELLGEYNRFANDGNVDTGLNLLRQGIDDYVDGAERLTVNTDLPNFDANGEISPERLREDVHRRGATAFMFRGSAYIWTGLSTLKRSQSYVNGFPPVTPPEREQDNGRR